MDRSRRAGTKRRDETPSQSRLEPPPASRLTVKARPNRRRATTGGTGTVWSRLPKPPVIADACGRALRRALPALVGIGVLGAVGGTAWAGYRFVTTSARF